MIINYLIKALSEKESVFVNNLGLFRKEYEPAQIKDGVITPPGYKVVFDPDFDGNGFAFTMFVSQKGGLLITEATTQIDQWVEQLKTALDNNKSVSFENFGTFAKNDKGIIVYHCDRIAELNVGYEGMEPLNLGKMKDDTENTDIDEVDEVDKIDEEIVEVEEVSDVESKHEEEIATEENPDDNKSEDEPKHHSENETDTDSAKDTGADSEEAGDKKHPWLVVLITLLIVALLAAAAYYFRGQLKEFYFQYFGKTGIVTEEATQETPEEITVNLPDSTLLADSLTTLENDTPWDETAILTEEQSSLAAMDNKQNDSPLVSQLPEGEKFHIDYEKGKYYVIVGSFRSEKEVRQHIKERKLEQYNPKVVVQQSSKNLRICIGVFDTENDADNYGRSTSLNYWVLK